MKKKLSQYGFRIAHVLLFFVVSTIIGCDEIALYERQRSISGAVWQQNEMLTFPIEIQDTLSAYNIFLSIRHTSLYPYRNVWVRLGMQLPGSDSVSFKDFDLPLSGNDAWLGVGMNDVYDRRVKLFGQPIRFTAKGPVVFTLQHIMREPNLKGILQAGVRIEPAL